MRISEGYPHFLIVYVGYMGYNIMQSWDSEALVSMKPPDVQGGIQHERKE